MPNRLFLERKRTLSGTLYSYIQFQKQFKFYYFFFIVLKNVFDVIKILLQKFICFPLTGVSKVATILYVDVKTIRESHMNNTLKVVLVFTLAAGLTACSKNIKDGANADLVTGTETVFQDTTVTQRVPSQEVALGAVHFDLDKYTLSADARKIVEANVKAIKAAGNLASYRITVEGNCDDRGTTSYNIALGQRRADEVKANYVRLGIPAANISTVSYGEEKPVCTAATQACWAKNRRADTFLGVK